MTASLPRRPSLQSKAEPVQRQGVYVRCQGRGGNTRELCCRCDSSQGQSPPPYKLWHQIPGISLRRRHAECGLGWEGHVSMAPRNAAEPVHPPRSKARAAGARPTGRAPAPTSAAISCCGLSPLLSSGDDARRLWSWPIAPWVPAQPCHTTSSAP